jgi:hypothetical protein
MMSLNLCNGGTLRQLFQNRNCLALTVVGQLLQINLSVFSEAMLADGGSTVTSTFPIENACEFL